MNSKSDKNLCGVLVTTEFRGVFFGYIDLAESFDDPLVLFNARNCLYWDASVKGFIGLAENGPNDKCRIGPRVSQLILKKIPSVAPVISSAVIN